MLPILPLALQFNYLIRVGHRFTKTSELIIPHLKNGDLAVIAINETVQSKFRD